MATERHQHRWLVVVALVLTGFSMRTAVVSIGPVLAAVQRAFEMSSSVSGVLTTLPVLCFALLGAVASRLAGRLGGRRLLVISLAAMTAGVAGRAAVTSVAAFFLLSLLALTGGAIANVVLPALVKEEFPHRIGPLTAVYTGAMALGMTAGAGLTVPIGSLAPAQDSWRVGLAFWALFSAAAAVPWLAIMRRDTRQPSSGPSMLAVAGSRVAWFLTVFFAAQAFQAYVAIGWFATMLHSQGMSAPQAGGMLAIFTAVSIPVYLASAAVPQRWHRPAIVAMFVAYVIGYVGLMTAPTATTWLWMVLVGVGGGEFPLVLVMIGLRSRDPRTTSALSAFVQSVGYVIGALGPILFGVLDQVSGAWTAPMAALLVATVISGLFGWLAAGSRVVEDDLAARASTPVRPSSLPS